jgi:hypothetical protein
MKAFTEFMLIDSVLFNLTCQALLVFLAPAVGLHYHETTLPQPNFFPPITSPPSSFLSSPAIYSLYFPLCSSAASPFRSALPSFPATIAFLSNPASGSIGGLESAESAALGSVAKPQPPTILAISKAEIYMSIDDEKKYGFQQRIYGVGYLFY